MTPVKASWVEVTQQTPCVACGQGHWCRVSADGASICRRGGADGYKERTDRHGVSYWMSFPGGTERDYSPSVRFVSEPGPEPATPDRLHRAYSELLSRLVLSRAHSEQMLSRGFTSAEVSDIGVKTLDQLARPVASQLAEMFPWWQEVPGLALKDGKPILCGWSGLLIPCKDHKGRIIGLRVRADSPDAPKYSWLSSAKYGGPSPGSPLSVWPAPAGSSWDRVRIVEGELKSAYAALRTGIPTICAPGVSLFSSDPMVELLLELQVAQVDLAADADFRTNRFVYQALRGAPTRLRAASFQVSLEVWDTSAKGIDDALQAGHPITIISPEEFLTMTAPPTIPADSTQQVEQTWEMPWPNPIAEEAYIGVIGAITRTIEPHSETDPAAIMFQAIVMAGHLIGAGPHYRVESTKHGTNENVAIVGNTAKARKGTSWDRIYEVGCLALGAGPEGVNIIKGIGSGEALISLVSDKPGHQDLPPSEVANSKRFLDVESELGSLLRVVGREGNILGPVFRTVFDGQDLQNNTKEGKLKASGYHVSLVGHITAKELRDLLSGVEISAGTANRFLFAMARRSKELPEGGCLGEDEMAELGAKLRKAIEGVRRMGKVPVVRDERARALWAKIYSPLSGELPGQAGVILARGEAHVTRLSLIYALLDNSSVVRVEHLLAGLAIWDYCVSSVYYLFGDKIGDSIADRVLSELRDKPEGLSRTDISKLFQNNKASADINRSLTILEEHGLATRRKERRQDPAQKRPTEIWQASNAINFVNQVGRTSAPSFLKMAKALVSSLPPVNSKPSAPSPHWADDEVPENLY